MTGKVVDASGRPVAGARVEGTLLMQQGIEGEQGHDDVAAGW